MSGQWRPDYIEAVSAARCQNTASNYPITLLTPAVLASLNDALRMRARSEANLLIADNCFDMPALEAFRVKLSSEFKDVFLCKTVKKYFFLMGNNISVWFYAFLSTVADTNSLILCWGSLARVSDPQSTWPTENGKTRHDTLAVTSQPENSNDW